MPKVLIERDIRGAGSFTDEEVQAIATKSNGVLAGMAPVPKVHGRHAVGDYVVGTGVASWPPACSVGQAVGGSGAAVPGGPGPAFHFPNGFAPGASFCLV